MSMSSFIITLHFRHVESAMLQFHETVLPNDGIKLILCVRFAALIMSFLQYIKLILVLYYRITNTLKIKLNIILLLVGAHKIPQTSLQYRVLQYSRREQQK